jgi:hypothetical protein
MRHQIDGFFHGVSGGSRLITAPRDENLVPARAKFGYY